MLLRAITSDEIAACCVNECVLVFYSPHGEKRSVLIGEKEIFPRREGSNKLPSFQTASPEIGQHCPRRVTGRQDHGGQRQTQSIRLRMGLNVDVAVVLSLAEVERVR